MTVKTTCLFAALLALVGACGSRSGDGGDNCAIEIRTALRHQGPFSGSCSDERVVVASLLCKGTPVRAEEGPESSIRISNANAAQVAILPAWQWNDNLDIQRIFLPPPAIRDDDFATDEYSSLTPEGVTGVGATYSLVIFENASTASCDANSGYTVEVVVEVPGEGTVVSVLQLGDGKSGETPLLERPNPVTLSQMQDEAGVPRYQCEGTCPEH